MDKNKRKELVTEYLNTKTEMGIYTFCCMPTNKYYLGVTQNTKAMLNGSKFRLGAGNHKNVNLQNDWNKHGEDNFTVAVLEVLDYDKDDDAKVDYTLELDELLNKYKQQYENVEAI